MLDNSNYNSYSIKRINGELLDELLPLYKIVFGKNYSPDYIRKKFGTKSFGAENIGYVAYYEGKIIACYVVFPTLMEYNNETILAAQSGDTMTHPAHRNKELFINLASKTFELAESEGIKFIFGFPNKKAYNGIIKGLQWKNTQNMNLYCFQVNTLPIASAARRIIFLNYVYLHYIKFILYLYRNNYNSLQHSISANEFVCIKHDTAYFNYKTCGGAFHCTISGVNVWLKINGTLFVGDMECTSSTNARKVFKDIKRLAFLLGCRKVIYSYSPNTFWDKRLSEIKSPEQGFSIAYLDFNSGLPLSRLGFSFSALDTF